MMYCQLVPKSHCYKVVTEAQNCFALLMPSCFHI